MPVGYDHLTPPVSASGVSRESLWEPLARRVLDGAYEATIAVAALEALKGPPGTRVKCYLTKVGGGVFRNNDSWIVEAIQRALDIHKHAPVDVKLVHFGSLQKIYGSIATKE